MKNATTCTISVRWIVKKNPGAWLWIWVKGVFRRFASHAFSVCYNFFLSLSASFIHLLVRVHTEISVTMTSMKVQQQNQMWKYQHTKHNIHSTSQIAATVAVAKQHTQRHRFQWCLRVWTCCHLRCSFSVVLTYACSHFTVHSDIGDSLHRDFIRFYCLLLVTSMIETG